MCSSDLFVEHIQSRVDDLRVAVQAGDRETLMRDSHNLKGVAASFSAVPLANLAAELEASSRQDDLSNAAIVVDRIQVEADRLREYAVTLGVKTG